MDPRQKHSGVTSLRQISSPSSDTPQLAVGLFIKSSIVLPFCR